MIGFICLTGLWIATGDVSADVETQDSIYTIYINSNADFVSQAATENWTGDGTKGNPYIIEDYDINASSAHGIEIRNTDVYFIIRNCVIYNGYEENVRSNYGIYFYNVTNGRIDSVISENNYYGIFLQNSLNNTIINSVCSDNNEEGIHLFSSSDNKISNCAAYNNFRGIGIYSSNNNMITNYISYGNHYYGIIFYSSNNNQITDSLFYKNGYGSIYFEHASNNIISNSTCSKSVTAIHLYYSNSNRIKECNISDNANGIRIVSSSNNNLIYNNTLYNAKNAWDECNNSWNSSSNGNYWSDYNGTDENNDGIGDTPYNIPGGYNKDNYPLSVVKKEGKEAVPEGMPLIYPAIICIVIILVCIMLYGVIETKTILIRCPACSKTFRVKKKPRPFKTECKYCNRKGMLK